ncbi:MAG TPA: tetratricopeptide repeat protein [Steroidobacteraceae bacterium]
MHDLTWRAGAMSRVGAVVIGAFILFALAGCGSAPSAPEQAAGSEQQKAEGQDMAVQDPLPPEALQRFEQAVVHMTAGDSAAAEQAFAALAAEYPQYSGALLNLGILHMKAGRLEEAEKALRAAIERNANNAMAFNQLGIVQRRLGRFSEADQSYQRALEIDPSYALAYLNLGVLCDLYLQQPERALEAYERYMELAGTPDTRVNGWITELRRRLGAEPKAARAQ